MKARSTLITISLVFLLTGCTDRPGPSMSDPQDFDWSIIKSPQTGRCYEVASRQITRGYSGFGFMGMSEVPCQ